MWKALDPYKWAGIAVLIASALLGLYAFGAYKFRMGEASANAAASVAREAETARQLEVNREAQRAASLTINSLRTTTLTLEEQLKENDRVAALDPTATGCGIELDGVRRIRSLGRTPSPPRRPFGIGGPVLRPGEPSGPTP